MEKVSYVYMMGSTSRRVLYTGVTAFFYLRVWQHKNNQGGYFTTKYKSGLLANWRKRLLAHALRDDALK